MTRITIYRVGQAEPVRIAGPTVPEPLGGAATARSRGYVRWLNPGLLIALFAAAVVLSLLFGREVYADITGVAGVAGHLRRLPHWLHYGVPAVAALVFVLVTYYLAFGRHVVLKAVTLGFFIALLATPGFALGYVNGNLSTMGSGGTAEQRAAVKTAQSVVQRPLPNKPMNILLLGIDHAGPGDPGRSDSQILVRLDPQLKTISMLSLPRDLRWNIPGIGYTKMNAAYTYGGPRLAIKTFEDITGLPINYFIRIDFAGFWHIVDIVGGVYLPIDHRYYVPVGAGYKSIDLQPGYQLVKAKQSLNFVRFRHDQNGDFTRMVRQQMFLREVQRQALRWSGNWGRVLAMTRAIMGQTTTDLDSLSKLLPVVNLALTLNTARIYQTHVEGSTPTINGVDYVVDTPEQIAAAVQQFENPGQPKASTAGSAVPKSFYLVTVSNGTGSSGLAQRTAAALQTRGYHVGPPLTSSQTSAQTVVYAPESLAVPAQQLANLCAPATLQLSPRAPGNDGHILIVLGSNYGGSLTTATPAPQAAPTVEKGQRYDWSAWRALAKTTSLKLEAPTLWAPGLGYDTAGVPFRSYSIETTTKHHAAAAIAVGTYGVGYWGVQAMHWTNPPAIANPSSVQKISGRTYLFFYQDKSLHMVAWKQNGDLYWVVNTLDNQIPNSLLLALAESCVPVTK